MSAAILLRCRFCRRGLTPLAAPAFNCHLCNSQMWVPAPFLTLTDRWRLWRQTGLAPWTTPAPLPE